MASVTGCREPFESIGEIFFIPGRYGLRDLSKRPRAVLAGVSKTNLNHIENGSDPRRSTLEAIQAAFQARGIVFVETAESVGVMMKK
jgi:predicted transcriptional regulator